jgi:ketosteroid isomerase-like protein
MWRQFLVLMAFIVCVSSVRAADGDVSTILSLRADSNAGLLAHDVDRVLLHTTDDFILVGGTSGGHVGKSVIRRYYIDGFAAPDLVTYVRTTDQVTVSDAGDRVSERGKWQGIWRSPKTGSLMSGEYLAHWMKKDGVWVTLAEVYVTLHCVGPVCTP